MNEIREKLKLLPDDPGVYIMLDADKNVIYVGKARNLKNRVRQYFHSSVKTEKVMAMVSNIADFYYVITKSEIDALALENNLIKKYKPKYNKKAGNSDYSYTRIKTIIKSQTNIRNFNVYDVRKLVAKLGLKTHIFNGSIYINAEDFDKMFAFVKETSNGVTNKEEWKKKVF